MPDITDQFADGCVKIYYATPGRPATAMRAVLEYAFAHQEPVPDAEVTDTAVEARFFIDHDMIHDRKTGKHVTTDDDSVFNDGRDACCGLLNELADLANRHPLADGCCATILSQRNAYKEERDIASARIAELEAELTVAQSPAIRLGEGLTEAQEAMSAEAKMMYAKRIDEAFEALARAFEWYSSAEGNDVWAAINARLSNMATALRASATPKPDPVDWVARAADFQRSAGPVVAKEIMAGLVAALRAKVV